MRCEPVIIYLSILKPNHHHICNPNDILISKPNHVFLLLNPPAKTKNEVEKWKVVEQYSFEKDSNSVPFDSPGCIAAMNPFLFTYKHFNK